MFFFPFCTCTSVKVPEKTDFDAMEKIVRNLIRITAQPKNNVLMNLK